MRAPPSLPPILRPAAAALCLLAVACGAGIPQQLPDSGPLSPHEVETYARRALQDARALRNEGRLEAAARVAAHGLEMEPDSAPLQRLRAELLEELGRSEEARRHRRVASLLDPAPPPLSEEPVEGDSRGLAVVLLPPPADPDLGDRVPRSWPSGPVASALGRRLAVRLPEAGIDLPQRDEPLSVEQARRELREGDIRAAVSLRVERAFCGETLKDGRFAVAWLRVAAASASPDEPVVAQRLRHTLAPPPEGAACRTAVVERALEEALSLPAVRALLAAAPPADTADLRWPRAAVRLLHPGLGTRIAEHLEAGREALHHGRLREARDHFAAAAAIDPADPEASGSLADAAGALALSQELAEVASAPPPSGPRDRGRRIHRADPGRLAPDYAAAESHRLQARLQEEQRRRRELEAAVDALDADRRAPGPSTLEALRPSELSRAGSVGPTLARRRLDDGAALEARVLYAPDGAVLARYYFAEGGTRPVLREEDGDDDGRPDRWVAFEAGARSRVWEDRDGDGEPDLELVFAPGGDPLERLLVDRDADGSPERVFRYQGGRLHAESRDTDGDGVADLFERFDAEGSLTLRERDVDGDGEVDVRTAYRAGRIVRREIVNPDAVTEIR